MKYERKIRTFQSEEWTIFREAEIRQVVGNLHIHFETPTITKYTLILEEEFSKAEREAIVKEIELIVGINTEIIVTIYQGSEIKYFRYTP